MDIYEVVMPVTLRDGKVAFEPTQSEKAKSIAVRNARSLKQIEAEPPIYQIVGDLRLKVGTVFAYDGNVKRMLGSQLKQLNPDSVTDEDPGPASTAGTESGEGDGGENGQGSDSQVGEIPPTTDNSSGAESGEGATQAGESDQAAEDKSEADPEKKTTGQAAKKAGKSAGQAAKKGS